ncbi:MAG: YwiC-like family protein [Planctomycetes bacterium]|nr:YwiC-like family protein [Planctomycetota bacterium]
MPREHGAWATAIGCWACGWAVAGRWAWEPLLLPVAAVLLLQAAACLRGSLRTRHENELPSRPGWLRFAAFTTAAAATGLAALHDAPLPWIAGLALPGLAYGAVIVAGKERAPAARGLGLAAFAGIGPAAYGTAAGQFGLEAALVWASLSAYFALVAALLVARLRASMPVLWGARLAAPAAAAGALAAASGGHAHWLLAAAFAMLALRAWAERARVPYGDPVRAGKTELVFSSAAVALILAGLAM